MIIDLKGLIVLPIVACSIVLSYSATSEPLGAIPLLDIPPVLDGKLDDREWSDAWESSAFVQRDGTAAQVETRAWVAQDQHGLWIGVKSDEPHMQQVRAKASRRNDRVWLDDAIEVFLDLNHDQTTYLHLVVNTQGVIFAQQTSNPPVADHAKPWEPWVRFAANKSDLQWSAELYLPFVSLPPMPPQSGTIGINICRDRMAGGDEQFSCMAPTFGSFHTPKAFGVMTGLKVMRPDVVAWPDIVAKRTGRAVNIESAMPVASDGRVLRWSAVIEDSAGRVLAEEPLAPQRPMIDSVAESATSLRLYAATLENDPVAVSPPVGLEAHQDIKTAVFQPYYDIEDHVGVAFEIDPAWRGARQTQWRLLNAQGAVHARGDVADRSAEGRIEVPIGELEPGEYTIQIVATRRDGSEAIGQTDFTKLPPPAALHKVIHDENGVIRIDGDPFLPVGIYRMTRNGWGNWLRDTGFNLVHDMGVGAGRFKRMGDAPIEWTTTLEEIESGLDEAERLGLKVLFDLGVYVKDVYEVEAGEEDGRRLREVVSRFRRHPALLAYYLIDEPYAQHYARAARAYDIVKQIDPNHPQIAPSLGRSFYYRPTSQLVDGMAVSSYPIPYRSVDAVGESLDLARKLAAPDTPLWFVPQAVGLRGAKSLPTVAELRNMTYQGFARDISGLIYFSWFGDRPRQNGELAIDAPEFWRALCDLTSELQDNRRLLLAEKDPAAGVEAPTGLDVIARRDADNRYLLIVNAKSRTAEIEITSGIGNEWHDVLSDRALSSAGPSLRIDVDPLGVYLLRQPTADGVPDYLVRGVFTGDTIASSNLLQDGGFEERRTSWEWQGSAKRSGRNAYEGRACLVLQSRGKESYALSESIGVEVGRRLFCSFHVQTSPDATGDSVDASVKFYNAAGDEIAVSSLVGPDERRATGMAWQWIGRAVEAPSGAVAMRLVLGTKYNQGTTAYDSVRVIDERELDIRAASPLLKREVE